VHCHDRGDDRIARHVSGARRRPSTATP
jgi:hypothetical protein